MHYRKSNRQQLEELAAHGSPQLLENVIIWLTARRKLDIWYGEELELVDQAAAEEQEKADADLAEKDALLIEQGAQRDDYLANYNGDI